MKKGDLKNPFKSRLGVNIKIKLYMGISSHTTQVSASYSNPFSSSKSSPTNFHYTPLFGSLTRLDPWFPLRHTAQLLDGCLYKCKYCACNWQSSQTKHPPSDGTNNKTTNPIHVFNISKSLNDLSADLPSTNGNGIGQMAEGASKTISMRDLIKNMSEITAKENEWISSEFSRLKHDKNLIGFGAGFQDPFPPKSFLLTSSGQTYLSRLTKVIVYLIRRKQRLLFMTHNPTLAVDVFQPIIEQIKATNKNEQTKNQSLGTSQLTLIVKPIASK